MKNGNNLSLRSVHIGKEKYSLTNTCAFDSILQLFIAAYFDTESIRDFISTDNEIDFKFFELIKEVTSYDIKKSSYRLRAIILKEIFTRKMLPNNCILINCEVSIGFLCRKLFQRYPSFEEVSKCTRGCPERVKALPLIQVKLSALLENNIDQIEKDITIQGLRSCCQSDCYGLENITISNIGIC